MEYEHNCIRPSCTNKYKDTDPDPYYCPSCKEWKKEVAKKINEQIASQPKKEARSALQEYDASPKVGGFMIYKP
jgi:hypothetical protein